MLKRLAFSNAWCLWMRTCITFSSFAVMVKWWLVNFLRSLGILGRRTLFLHCLLLLCWRPLIGVWFVGEKEDTLEVIYLFFVDDMLLFFSAPELYPASTLIWRLLWTSATVRKRAAESGNHLLLPFPFLISYGWWLMVFWAWVGLWLVLWKRSYGYKEASMGVSITTRL